MSPTTSVVPQPRQARSARSLERLLDAAEHLLRDRSFADLTVADVVREARSSVGVFYARIGDKENLLAALHERHQQQVMASFDGAWSPEAWRHGSLEDVVRACIHAISDLYLGNPGLYRTLVLRGHATPSPEYDDPSQRNRLGVAGISRLLMHHGGEIGHPLPERATSLAALVMISTLREKLLFGHGTARAAALADGALEDELARLVLTYLEARDEPQSRRG